MLYKIFSCPFLKEAVSPGVVPVYQTCQLNEDSVGKTFALKIRTAQPTDLKGLVNVLSRSFHTSQTILPGLQPILKLGMYEDMRIRLRSDRPNYRCLVASQTPTSVVGGSETIVGTVEIGLRTQFLTRQIPYISNLAIIPEYRRQGIARQLLFKCEQIAFDWGYEELSLHVLENNLAAQQLYFNDGYKLQKIEHSLSSWLFNQPRRLFLAKKIKHSCQCCD